MESRYKIVIYISFLLLTLSLGSSFINYRVSMKDTEYQLKTQSLPLSVDNIYTEIQKNIIEPYLISSMMANDTFVKDWIIHEEDNVDKIYKYLASIKNKYGMIATFLVSDKSHNYYTHNGFLEKVQKSKPQNQWYFKFKDIADHQEINLDLNQHLANSMMMFINFKIFDKEFNYLGATGVAIKISYINDMLKMFHNKYKLKVTFSDSDGNIVLSENQNEKNNQGIADKLDSLKDKILIKNTNIVEYEKDGDKYILNTKYIEELDIYLLVEAKLDDFSQNTKQTFYRDASISLLLTLIIAILIFRVINNYNKRLEKSANYDYLTKIPNRRTFTKRLKFLLLLSKRKEHVFSLLFIDLDDFKDINDKFGHQVGDKILKEFASILKQNTRKTDMYARWGGEEFVVMFVDTPLEQATIVADNIRVAMQNSAKINDIIDASCTISCGLTEVNSDDTVDSVTSRADKAMYTSKTTGKNKVSVI